MPAFEVRIAGVDQAKAAISRLSSKFDETYVNRMRAALFVLQGFVRTEASGRSVGGALSVSRSGGTRKARGTLARSFTTSLDVTRGKLRGAVGSNLRYSGILEYGGAIVPVHRKWLTIPATATAANRTAPEMDLEFIKIRPDLAMLVDDSGVVQYWLRKRVKIPPFRYVSKAQRKAEKPVAKMLDDGVVLLLKEFSR